MKTQIFTLTICTLLLAAVDSGRAQTNTTPKTTTQTNSITYTLDIDPGDGTKAVHNPTEADIRKAVASLRGDTEPGFLILRKDAAHVIQVTCVAHDSFAIQSQEGDEQHQFQATKNLSAETTTKLLLAYRNGDADWKKLTDWKPMWDDTLESGGSSSAPDSGLTKQELRDIYKVVARYTTNKIETVLIPLPDCVEVTTETQEIFNLRHYPTGWELTHRTKF